MTKKRHAKLLRAFITRIHEKALAEGGYPNGWPKDMYKAVRMANDGHQPEPFNRGEWWQKVGKNSLEIWGMGDIKEVNRKSA